MSLSKKLARRLLYQMYLIRAFDEQADQSYVEGKVHGTIHVSIGQEASSVGSISALNPDDYILSTHRGHGHCIAKDADPKRMMAELYGKEAGYCHGRGGSMHIADVEGGNLGANGVVGGGNPMAVGVGIGLKMKNNKQVAICFFGDGAMANGSYHESMQLAVLFNIPIVFICENNQYAMSFPTGETTTSEQLAESGEYYGMPGTAVDGNDILAVRKVVQEAVERARAGDGPSLVITDTYRRRAHSRSDRDAYRDKKEIEAWQEKDPIHRFQKYITNEGLLTVEEIGEIKEQAYAEIEAARIFAESADEPALETIEDGVYAP
jgi:acetoin:2,6-dichlorophenolindophenol oxidoreductase subunit alpha